MANYTKSFNFRNGVQVDDDNFIINPNGLVGIGTSVPRKHLDVYGDARVSGIASLSDVGVTGIITAGNIKIDSGTGEVTATKFIGDASGMSGVVAISTVGWISGSTGIHTETNVGIGSTIPKVKLDVIGDANIVGYTTTGNAKISNLEIITYSRQWPNDSWTGWTQGVTVASQGRSTIIQAGGSNTTRGYVALMNGGPVYIGGGTDGVNGPDWGLNLVGMTTVFGNLGITSNLDVSGITTLAGSGGITTTGGDLYVGGKLDVDSSVQVGGGLTVSGISTFAGITTVTGTTLFAKALDVAETLNVVGVSAFENSINCKNVSADGTLNVSGDASFSGDVTLGNVAGDKIYPTGRIGSNLVPQSDSIDLGLSGTAWGDIYSSKTIFANQFYSTGITTVSGLYDNGVKRFEATGVGVSVYNELNVASLDGGTSGLSTYFGALRYGNESGSFGYSTRKSLDLLNYDTGNINFYLDAGNQNTGIGSFHWHKGPSTTLMTLNADGNLGIGITEPEYKLHVSGISTFTGNVTCGNDLTVNGNLTLSAGSFNGNVTGNVTGNITGSIYADETVGMNTISLLKSDGIGIGVTSKGDRLRINFNPGTTVYVTDGGKIGISTDIVYSQVKLAVPDSAAVFSAVGVGTTSLRCVVDFANAGATSNNYNANITSRFMLPPSVDTTERNNFTGVGAGATPSGAMIYNNSTNTIEVYTGSQWTQQAAGGATDLNSLSDVTITGSPTPGQFLKYTGSGWENATGSIGNLTDLTDVVITGTPNAGDTVQWDSGTSKWVNGANSIAQLNDITNVNITTPSANDVIQWDTGSNKWINGPSGSGGIIDSGSFTATPGSPSTLNTYVYGAAELVFEYTVFVKNGSDYQTQKLLVMRDGTAVTSTQYGIMYSNSLLVNLDATITGGANLLLQATPETGVTGSTTYRLKREVT